MINLKNYKTEELNLIIKGITACYDYNCGGVKSDVQLEMWAEEYNEYSFKLFAKWLIEWDERTERGLFNEAFKFITKTKSLEDFTKIIIDFIEDANATEFNDITDGFEFNYENTPRTV
jgi:hypothetical protein